MQLYALIKYQLNSRLRSFICFALVKFLLRIFRRQPQQFFQRPGEAAEFSGGHGQRVPFRRDRMRLLGVGRQRHRHEAVQFIAEFEELFGRERARSPSTS